MSSIDIELVCECGSRLNGRTYSNNGTMTITIEPCEKCMYRNSDGSYDAGYSDGWAGGHDSGYEEGVEQGHKDCQNIASLEFEE